MCARHRQKLLRTLALQVGRGFADAAKRRLHFLIAPNMEIHVACAPLPSVVELSFHICEL